MVNSALVGGEIGVDSEGSFDGAVGHNFGLDLGDLGGDAVDGLGKPLIVGVGGGVGTDAGGLALGGGLGSSARLVFSGGVVVALSEGVRHAPVGGVVEPAANEALVLPVVHGSRGISSVASLSAGDTTAGQHVLSRDSHLEGLATGNADTVADALNSAESPAGSASALVTNFLDGFTFRPSLSGGELFRNILKGLNILEGESLVLRGLESSHKVLDLLNIHTIKVVVVSCLPVLLDGVDVLNDVLEVKEDLVLFGDCAHAQDHAKQSGSDSSHVDLQSSTTNPTHIRTHLTQQDLQPILHLIICLFPTSFSPIKLNRIRIRGGRIVTFPYSN